MIVTVTDTIQNSECILYIKQNLSNLINQTGGEIKTYSASDRACISVDYPEYYKDVVKVEIVDCVAEIIAIRYKYEFFRREIKVGGLNADEREILFASLISADLEEDKRYIFEKAIKFDNICIDGTYNFTLLALKRKWKDIISYIPPCFLSGQLRDFVTFLLETKKKRVYVDSGKVYDSHYRRLKRCDLLGGENLKIIREVLLSNCGEIELKGNLPQLDEKYMREYYGDKVYFMGK